MHFCAVLGFLPIFRAVFVQSCGFNSSLRFAFSHRNLVRFFGFWPFRVAVLRFLSFLNTRGVLSAIKNSEKSPIRSVSFFIKSTYDFLGKNNDIKVLLHAFFL